jgi:hypothetical protein
VTIGVTLSVSLLLRRRLMPVAGCGRTPIQLRRRSGAGRCGQPGERNDRDRHHSGKVDAHRNSSPEAMQCSLVR